MNAKSIRAGNNRVKIIIKVILDDINTISMTQHICAQIPCKDTRVTFVWICSRFFFFLRKQTHRRLSLSKKIVLFTQVRRCLNSETSNSNLISRFLFFFLMFFPFVVCLRVREFLRDAWTVMIANWPFMAEYDLRAIRFNRCAAHIGHIARTHTRQSCPMLMIHAYASAHILSVLSIFLLVVNCACKYLCKCIRMARIRKKRTVFFAALMKTRNNQCINGFCDRRSTFSVSFIFTWSTIATCAVISDFKCVSDYYIWIIDGFGAVCGMRLYHSVGKCIVVYATWTIIMSTTFE